ncbi:MAG: hypothetical protein L6R45_29620 [Anaerolineae bacterium]|nr:hypothetical protein [Anaerolineae bacterium]
MTRLQHPAATAATLAENEQARQRIRDLELTITHLNNRLDQLTAAARELCYTRLSKPRQPEIVNPDGTPYRLPPHLEDDKTDDFTLALRALAELVDYPGWYQL